MFTLNTIEQHSVCYGIDQQGGKSNCGCHKDVMPTLCSDSHGTPHAVCFQLCGDRDDPSVSVSENAYCVPANPMSDRSQAVCYGISPYDSKGMKSSNPHAGIYVTDTSRTLDANGGNPACNQGGVVIVYEGQNCGTNAQSAYTIQAGRADDHHISVVCHERKQGG